MAGYGLIGSFTTRPGARDALVELLLEASELLRTAPGCEQWLVHASATDADRVWVTEIWTDRDAHDASLSLPGVRDVIGRAMPLVAGPPQSFETIPRGGVGG